MHDRLVKVFTDAATMRLMVIFTFVSALLFRLVLWDLANTLSKYFARKRSAKRGPATIVPLLENSQAKRSKPTCDKVSL